MATAVELCILFLVIMIKNDLRWRWIYFFLTIEFPIYLNTGILQLILLNSLQFLTTVHLYLNGVGGRVCVCMGVGVVGLHTFKTVCFSKHCPLLIFRRFINTLCRQRFVPNFEYWATLYRFVNLKKH